MDQGRAILSFLDTTGSRNRHGWINSPRCTSAQAGSTQARKYPRNFLPPLRRDQWWLQSSLLLPQINVHVAKTGGIAAHQPD